MKKKLQFNPTKICLLLPICMMLLAGNSFPIGILNYLFCGIDKGIAEYIFSVICFLGWIPSLISAVLGIVFSVRSLKEMCAKKFLICSFFNFVLAVLWCGLFCSVYFTPKNTQSENTAPQYLFQDVFSHYEFIEKKELHGEIYSLFLCDSGFSDKVSFVQVYVGDLESAFKNNEKIPYREAVLNEYIDDKPDEDLHSTRYQTNIYFSDDGKSVIVEFNNGEKQIITMEKNE